MKAERKYERAIFLYEKGIRESKNGLLAFSIENYKDNDPVYMPINGTYFFRMYLQRV